MANQPLLSICIPTKNRAHFLNRVMKSIVSQTVFLKTEDVQIVISDNASSDNTREVVGFFLNQFPGKIMYYCHSEDIGAALNLAFVLNRATGTFLKLNNDTLLVNSGSLDKMLRIVKDMQEEKPILFFHNTNENQQCRYTNINSFITDISYYVTWIGSFGLWRSDLLEFPDLYREAKSLLPQVDIIFRFFESGRQAIVLKEHLFTGIPNINKGGYNISEVFGQNYLLLLKKQLNKKLILRATYFKEKKRILKQHINPYYFDIQKLHRFNTGGYFKYLKKYRWHFYFYLDGLYWSLKGFFFRFFFSETKYRAFAWEFLNSHNRMIPVNKFCFSKVLIGNHSYGHLNIISWGQVHEMLVIGHFVSVAAGVKFLLGGNHAYKCVSTFPFKAIFDPPYLEATTKGPIVVEDDVWIGLDSLILSGVTIGQGAIVAAMSVVTKDVPPYSIVGGNPAHVLKYRFSQVVIDQLKFLNFSTLTTDMIREKVDLLYTEVNEATVSELVKAFNANVYSQNKIELFVK